MKNKIIIEGFWNIGKATLAREISKDCSHLLIMEPNHLGKGIAKNRINSWYVKEHSKNQKVFFKEESAILERSIISSAAFFYATGREIDHKILKSFIAVYKKEKPLIVFLYADGKTVEILSKEVRDPTIKKLLKNQIFVKKYEEFYRNILPFLYDIVPVLINVGTISKRKTVKEIKQEIIKAVENNRLAQISVFCYKIEKEPLFLLLKRNAKKGGFWQGITGGVKINQTLQEALFAETQEELGLKLRFRDILETGHSFSFTGSEGYELNEYVFGYRLREGDKFVLSDEHSEYKFVALKEAGNLLKYETNKVAIKKIAKMIKKT